RPTRDRAAAAVTMTAAAAAPGLNQARPFQDVVHRAQGGKLDARMAALQQRPQFLRAPGGVIPAGGDDQRADVGRRFVGMAVGGLGPIFEGRIAALLEAADPEMPGLAGDAVCRAETADGALFGDPVVDEIDSFGHWTGLFPGHRQVSLPPKLPVRHPPGSKCQASPRFVPEAGGRCDQQRITNNQFPITSYQLALPRVDSTMKDNQGARSDHPSVRFFVVLRGPSWFPAFV